MNLWEVQGSYRQPDKHYKSNRTVFVLTDTLERACALWYRGLPDDCGSPEVHQAIRRNSSNTELYVDTEIMEAPNAT